VRHERTFVERKLSRKPRHSRWKDTGVLRSRSPWPALGPGRLRSGRHDTASTVVATTDYAGAVWPALGPGRLRSGRHDTASTVVATTDYAGAVWPTLGPELAPVTRAQIPLARNQAGSPTTREMIPRTHNPSSMLKT